MSAVLENIAQTAVKTAEPNGTANGVIKTRLISVAVYDQMIEHGILTSKDKLELLNGLLIEKMTKGIKHAALKDLIGDLFREKLGDKVYIRLQNPIVLDDFSEPEPDVAICLPPRRTYLQRHPTPADIFLLIEISDSTLSLDRNLKQIAYARAGIRQYVLLNVQNSTLEDYREPAADGYQSKQTLRAGQTLTLAAFPETEINLDEIFV